MASGNPSRRCMVGFRRRNLEAPFLIKKSDVLNGCFRYDSYLRREDWVLKGSDIVMFHELSLCYAGKILLARFEI